MGFGPSYTHVDRQVGTQNGRYMIVYVICIKNIFKKKHYLKYKSKYEIHGLLFFVNVQIFAYTSLFTTCHSESLGPISVIHAWVGTTMYNVIVSINIHYRLEMRCVPAMSILVV
ncbi:hypothetical protein CI610_03475 [invertebrate metagenome]|uniref:Uncharacterized protein n=1 Tax=invertebrate metagenome TaxID=1711999 RepID=A0A2H9T2Z2_9ZZZZ